MARWIKNQRTQKEAIRYRFAMTTANPRSEMMAQNDRSVVTGSVKEVETVKEWRRLSLEGSGRKIRPVPRM